MPQIALIVLDGWGYREDTNHNAVAEAETPVFDALWANNPHSLLEASGEAVGLPDGQIGNSEIGHMTIGAGTVIDTDLVRINKAIRAGSLGENTVLRKLFAHVKAHGSSLHVMGLASPGGIHSHSDHLVGFIRAAKAAGVEKLVVHAFTDGRDTPPRAGAEYLREIEAVLTEVGIGRIATVSGRYYAMDRDTNWDRTAKAEAVMFEGKGEQRVGKASSVVDALYAEGKQDEHLEPVVILDDSGQPSTIQPNDAVFFFNYRLDRTRQTSKKILERIEGQNIVFGTMTQYDPTILSEVAFPPMTIETTLAAEISKAGLSQQHVAETEKFPHATYFLNGGREAPHPKEEHVMLASRKDIKTHDEAPEMRAEGIADEAIKRIADGVDFTFINFANPDMVGHTGNHPAIVKGVEKVDLELDRVVKAIRANNGILFITADHGNAEYTQDEVTGEKHTAHTLSRVPAILVGSSTTTIADGTLADITPTILELMQLPIPKTMGGKSLLR